MSDQRIQALTQFRLANYRRFSRFRADDAARESVLSGVRRDVETAQEFGRSLFLEHSGKVHASWLWWKTTHPFFGQEVPEFRLDFDAESPDAIRWVRDLLRSRRSRFPANTYSEIGGQYAFLIPELAAVGLPVDGVELLGECERSLAALGPALPRLPYGLIWRPIRTREDVFGVLELRRRVFGELPQYAWFAQHPEHTKVFRARLEAELDEGHLWHVLVRGREVLGFVGSSLGKPDPLWGPCGGVEFVLDSSLRGRGLGKEAYRRTLGALLRKDVAVYTGCTCNPAIIAMGAKMAREVVNFHVRQGGPFDERHFHPLI